MHFTLPKINPQKEKETIVKFIQNILKKTKKEKIVIGLSGGIDSTTVFYLLKQAIPQEKIVTVALDYYDNLPHSRSVLEHHIKPIVDMHQSLLNINKENDKIRFGNIIARTRMIILFDYAKKYNALVCGTENKSEHHLGYFTRFGDAAADIEPIQHLYKTQIYELAKYLKVPKTIINRPPSADLWPKQTDESHFGFTYQEADKVIYLLTDKKLSINEIKKKKINNTDKIISWINQNKFKSEVPYFIK